MVSLVIGAAGAVGIYAALDETDVTIEPTRVVVQQPNEGASAKHESSTASAIGGPVQSSSTGVDEASTAAAVGGRANPYASFPGKGERSTAADHGGPRQRTAPDASGKDEASTAAAVGGSSQDEPSQGTLIGGAH
jgi:hypothetical protein